MRDQLCDFIFEKRQNRKLMCKANQQTHTKTRKSIHADPCLKTSWKCIDQQTLLSSIYRKIKPTEKIYFSFRRLAITIVFFINIYLFMLGVLCFWISLYTVQYADAYNNLLFCYCSEIVYLLIGTCTLNRFFRWRLGVEDNECHKLNQQHKLLDTSSVSQMVRLTNVH